MNYLTPDLERSHFENHPDAPAESLVFGANTGSSAFIFARRHTLKKVAFNSRQWLTFLIQGNPNPRMQSELRSLRRGIQNIAWKLAGPIRDEGGLKKALLLLEETRSDLQAVRVSTSRELVQKEEVENSLLVTRAMLSRPWRGRKAGGFPARGSPRRRWGRVSQRSLCEIEKGGSGTHGNMGRRIVNRTEIFSEHPFCILRPPTADPD